MTQHEPAWAEIDEQTLASVLPPRAKAMADAIGLPATVTLCQAVGGERLSIPTAERLREDHPLVSILGFASAHALAASSLGGQRIEVPRLACMERLLRDNALRSDFDRGDQLHVVSRRYAVTGRQARRILAARPETAPRANTRPQRLRVLVTTETPP